MNWHDPKSPIWPLVHQIIVAIVLIAFLKLNYNGWDERDWNTLVGVLTAVGLLDGAKSVATKSGGE